MEMIKIPQTPTQEIQENLQVLELTGVFSKANGQKTNILKPISIPIYHNPQTRTFKKDPILKYFIRTVCTSFSLGERYKYRTGEEMGLNQEYQHVLQRFYYIIYFLFLSAKRAQRKMTIQQQRTELTPRSRFLNDEKEPDLPGEMGAARAQTIFRRSLDQSAKQGRARMYGTWQSPQELA